MWSMVQVTSGQEESSAGRQVPCARSKHAMCVSQDGYFYLLGGRSANLPLKDLWRFDPVQCQWEDVRCRGSRPPCLQEHTVVSWKSKLYVFGGEIGFASTGETPLWIFDIGTGVWRKQHARSGTHRQPSGRRGHTAVVYNGAMHIYGGYQDLRGSSSELWSFNFDSEQWQLTTPSGGEGPPARHNHSSVIHDGAMWVYGGMTDLQERSDFWKYDFVSQQWNRVKTQRGGPGELHSHAAVKAMAFMYIFGGERGGVANNELWRYHFATDTWERIQAEGVLPGPRCRHVALANPNAQKWAERVATIERGPPKSFSMVFGGEPDHSKKSFRFKVHPVSRLCSKHTGSDDEEDLGTAYVAAYNHATAQVNLKSLKEKISSSRLVRSISSGNYSILTSRRDELEKLLEESTPQLQRPSIQKSQSSDAVLESDSESSTPQHRAVPKTRPLSEILPASANVLQADNLPGRISPPTTGPRQGLRTSQSLTFASRTLSAHQVQNGETLCCCRLDGHSPCENCGQGGVRASRRVYDGPLTTVSDLDEEHTNNREDMLIDLADIPDMDRGKSSGYTSFSTLSEVTSSQLCTPSVECHGLPHSVSHCSGYYSFAEDDTEFQRDLASFLNSNGRKRPSSISRDAVPMELKTFTPTSQQPTPTGGLQPKERARSWDRVSQRDRVSGNRGASHPQVTTPRAIQAIKEESSCNASPIRRWQHTGNSPAKAKLEQHHWQLCLYVFGGREQGVPGVYRQPIAVWKLYV